jgi:aminocarboxymuconate-semialdehyde decarboxylase
VQPEGAAVTITDLHAHLIRAEALDEMRAAHPDVGATLSERENGYYLSYPGRAPLGPVPRSMFDVDRRLADMKSTRVERQVLAVPPPQFHYHVDQRVGIDFARIQNDSAIDLSDQYPRQFHVFATLPLQAPEAAVRELRRVAEHPRVRGVEIGTNVNGVNLDAAELEPLWSELEGLDLPVWVHPDQRSIAGAERLQSYYLVNLIGNPLESTIAIACLIFGGVLERHPRLRFGFVHGGGFAPYQTGRWDHGWECRDEPRAHAPKTPTGYVRRLFFDSLTHDRASLELLGTRVGWRQVVLGSDYPFDMASADPVGEVEALGLGSDDESGVLGDNGERFLRPHSEVA